MSEENKPDETPAEAPPAWFDDYQKQMNQQLGQAFDNIGRQQQATMQQMQQGQEAQVKAQTPKPKLPENADEKILNELFNNPTRFVAEMGQINRDQAAQISSQAIAEYKNQQQGEQQAGQFWQEFYQHNSDLQNYGPMITHMFHSQPAGIDPSERANTAANQVRQLVAQERANAIEDQKRQSREKNLISSPAAGAFPGISMPEGSEGEVDPQRATEDAVMDLNKARAKRMAVNW
jgi:hypothetical protein